VAGVLERAELIPGGGDHDSGKIQIKEYAVEGGYFLLGDGAQLILAFHKEMPDDPFPKKETLQINLMLYAGGAGQANIVQDPGQAFILAVKEHRLQGFQGELFKGFSFVCGRKGRDVFGLSVLFRKADTSHP